MSQGLHLLLLKNEDFSWVPTNPCNDQTTKRRWKEHFHQELTKDFALNNLSRELKQRIIFWNSRTVEEMMEYVDEYQVQHSGRIPVNSDLNQAKGNLSNSQSVDIRAEKGRHQTRRKWPSSKEMQVASDQFLLREGRTLCQKVWTEAVQEVIARENNMKLNKQSTASKLNN